MVNTFFLPYFLVVCTSTASTGSNVLSAILEIFLAVGEWISGAVSSLTPMFWSAETGLTFLGVLAVAGLGFSVIFLITGLIQRFLHVRG